MRVNCATPSPARIASPEWGVVASPPPQTATEMWHYVRLARANECLEERQVRKVLCGCTSHGSEARSERISGKGRTRGAGEGGCARLCHTAGGAHVLRRNLISKCMNFEHGFVEILRWHGSVTEARSASGCAGREGKET